MDTLANPPTVFTPSIYYGEIQNLSDAVGKGILAPSNIGSSLLGKQKVPTTYNYSFGVQQQIGRSIILDLGYTGSISRHQLWKRNINATPFGASWTDVNPQNMDPTNGTAALPNNFLRPIIGYGDINIFEFGSTSNYNSLQFSANRRWTKGFMIGFAYTFSKVLGSANTDTTSVSAFMKPREWNYGPLAYDRNHVASLRYSYQIPKLGKKLNSRMLGLVTDNWEVSGTGRFQTGGPFTPGWAQVDYINQTGSTEGARISVGNPNAPEVERFVRPLKGTFGNSGSNTLRNGGVNLFDTSVNRTIRLREKLTCNCV